jgi:uncharacterized protein (DUF486 family)
VHWIGVVAQAMTPISLWLLIVSNVAMMLAWFGHLKFAGRRPWIVILAS